MRQGTPGPAPRGHLGERLQGCASRPESPWDWHRGRGGELGTEDLQTRRDGGVALSRVARTPSDPSCQEPSGARPRGKERPCAVTNCRHHADTEATDPRHVPRALTRPRPAPQEVPTLRQLWARGQQVLLSYEDEAARSRHRVLWPGAPYWWGDQVKPEKLICYLEHMKSCGRPGGCRRQVPWAGWAQREGDGRPVRASACTGVSHIRAHTPTGCVCKCEHVQIRAHTPVHTCADTCTHACPHTCMWPL